MNVGFIICGQLRLSVLLGPTEKCTNRRRPYLHWPHVRDCASVKFDLFSAQAKNNWSLTLRRFRKHYWVPIAISVGTRSGMKTPHIPSWVSCEEWGADRSAVISIHLLLQIANKKLLQSKFQLSGFQDGAGYWACGNDFLKASSQWVFLFPRDLAHWRELPAPVRGCLPQGNPKARGTPHLSLQRPGVG